MDFLKKLSTYFKPKNKQNNLNPPYRIGKKQNRAVLDKDGNTIVVFDKGKEIYAKILIKSLNGKENNT